MNQITFLHCAGLNLGYGFRVSGYSDAKKLTIRREDLKKGFTKILEIASYEKADFILISGNFIDTNNIDQATIDFINDIVSQYQDIQIVILIEEDSKAKTRAYESIVGNDNITILTSDNNLISYANKSTIIYGINKNSNIKFTELLNDDNAQNKAAKFKIVMSNTQISSHNDMYKPYRFLIEKGVNYIACGYSKNRIHDELGDELFYNCGTSEPLDADEIGAHGIYSVTITKKDDGFVKKDIAFIETAIRTYHSVDIDISECFTVDAIKDVILNKVKPNLTDVYYINLIGKVIPDLDYNNEKIVNMLEEEFFDISVFSEKVENYDIETIILEPGIRGVFAKKLVDEINSTSNIKQKSILKKALYFGIIALDGRQIQL